MMRTPDYITAQSILLEAVTTVETERVPLEESYGRVLAHDLIATEDTPSFDRSPYDGYALQATDTAEAGTDRPVMLRVSGWIAAGETAQAAVTKGTAVKVLTGAAIPEGADAVVPFERTRFTGETVAVFAPVKAGENIVYAGEDIRKGCVLAHRGETIDPGLAGVLASQGEGRPLVHRTPRVGIISTGGELSQVSHSPALGQIRDSNRYVLQAALGTLGCQGIWLGAADDRVEEIAELFRRGLTECDAIVSTGGVSVGDRDLTPEAMELAGITPLFRGMDIKPGMACAYGVCTGKPVCCLSGNPASALTNFYVAAVPALKKLAGRREVLPQELKLKLLNGFGKQSPVTRFLRGRLVLKNGLTAMVCPKEQGNVVLSSAIGCDAMAIVPAGSGPVADGTVLKGFLL